MWRTKKELTSRSEQEHYSKAEMDQFADLIQQFVTERGWA